MNKNFEQKLEKIIFELGYVLYDIEKDIHSKNMIFRILIQKKDFTNVDLEDCEKVSRAIGDIIDGEINKEYILEVCSPGIEKKLTKPKHYKQVEGELIEVKTYKKLDGFDNNKIVGILEFCDENKIIINDVEIYFNDISMSKSIYQFERK